jgi:Gas vesicle synthesis protein GvpL/GvpF
MTVLAYCITETEPDIQVASVGLEGHVIRSLTESGLRCFISDYGKEAAGKPVRESALTFSRVLQDIFGQLAIIPFCFPTLLPSEAEIAGFVRENADEYRKTLSRLRDSVQMDVHISLPEQKLEAGDESGTDYLTKRLSRHQHLERVAEELRRAAQPWIQDWRQREVAAGMRGHALVARGLAASFLEKMAGIEIPAGFHVRVTGPWPAAEFLKEK